jgi:hypothetical protein
MSEAPRGKCASPDNLAQFPFQLEQELQLEQKPPVSLKDPAPFIQSMPIRTAAGPEPESLSTRLPPRSRQ